MVSLHGMVVGCWWMLMVSISLFETPLESFATKDLVASRRNESMRQCRFDLGHPLEGRFNLADKLQSSKCFALWNLKIDEVSNCYEDFWSFPSTNDMSDLKVDFAACWQQNFQHWVVLVCANAEASPLKVGSRNGTVSMSFPYGFKRLWDVGLWICNLRNFFLRVCCQTNTGPIQDWKYVPFARRWVALIFTIRTCIRMWIFTASSQKCSHLLLHHMHFVQEDARIHPKCSTTSDH